MPERPPPRKKAAKKKVVAKKKVAKKKVIAKKAPPQQEPSSPELEEEEDDFDEPIEEGDLEMLDTTESYLVELEKTFNENVGALETIGGNIMIHIYGVATRTIITSGSTKGFYDDATDDPIDFAMGIQQWVLLHMLDPDDEDPIDLEKAQEDGSLFMEGDPTLYERFMKLGRTKKNLLSIRGK